LSRTKPEAPAEFRIIPSEQHGRYRARIHFLYLNAALGQKMNNVNHLVKNEPNKFSFSGLMCPQRAQAGG